MNKHFLVLFEKLSGGEVSPNGTWLVRQKEADVYALAVWYKGVRPP